MTYLEAAATLSPCGLYRYDLTRVWEAFAPRCLWVMLNPSTADGAQDDPTIRRCVGFSKAWGFGGLVVCNLFALRATDPGAVLGHPAPVGPDADAWIRDRLTGVERVVCGWGNSLAVAERAAAVLAIVRAAGRVPHHLGLTKDGQPRHPLYLKGTTVPVPFTSGGA